MPVASGRFGNETLQPLIVQLRGQRVILDVDLARLYGVLTKVLNQAVKRNSRRFPNDFSFRLTAREVVDLRSQSVTSSQKRHSNSYLGSNWSQFVTSSGRRRGTIYRPLAFTEHGALMAAHVLRSERAIQMSIYVTRAFVRLREHIAANAAILKRLAEIDETLLRHDTALRDVYRKLQPLLAPPAEAPKRRIGF